MFTREDYISSVAHEVAVLKHLFTKLPEDSWDYRPTPAQRSMRELLQFIPATLATVAKWLVAGSFDPVREEFKAMTQKPAENFPAELDARFEEFKAIIENIPDSEFRDKIVKLPTGIEVPLGRALVDMNLKFLAAYRMQFFLYLKSVGRTELSTANLWGGKDMPIK